MSIVYPARGFIEGPEREQPCERAISVGTASQTHHNVRRHSSTRPRPSPTYSIPKIVRYDNGRQRCRRASSHSIPMRWLAAPQKLLASEITSAKKLLLSHMKDRSLPAGPPLGKQSFMMMEYLLLPGGWCREGVSHFLQYCKCCCHRAWRKYPWTSRLV